MRYRDAENPTRKAIVNFVSAFWREHKYGPTIREIGEGVGVTSTSIVNYHVNVLVEDGKLVRDDFISRSIRPAGMSVVFELE